MRLVSLKIYKKKNGEVIRDVKFNNRGLSLICDLEGEENKAHGSSIGKTAFIRCIDLCLGAKSTNILYHSKTLGTNQPFKEYLFGNQVCLSLTCEINGKTLNLERNIFDNREYVDGEEFSNIDLYCQKLKEIFFPNSPSNITFRQMILLFVRIDIEEPIKYLANFAKNQQYNMSYSYFLNLYVSDEESSLHEELQLKNTELNKLKSKYRVKNEQEFSNMVKEKEKLTNEKKQAIHNTDYVDSYASSDIENEKLVDDLDSITEELNSKKYKSRQLLKIMQSEKGRLFELDEELLKELYDDASKYNELNESFKEFCTFHNDMCKLRINKYIEEKNAIDEEIKALEEKAHQSREKFSKGFVEYKVSVDDQESSLFATYYSAKKDYQDTKDDFAKYNELAKEISALNASISKIDSKKEINKDNIGTFSSIFEGETEKLVENAYLINYETKFDKMMITIQGTSGNPGTGDSKVMSYALNASLYKFFMQKLMSMPLFSIQDRMENVEIAKLERIIDDVRSCGIQYIVPILNDRINTLGIEDKEIILKLSKDNKLFKF